MDSGILEVGREIKVKKMGEIDEKIIMIGKADVRGTCFVCGKPVITSAKNEELELEADVCYNDSHCHDNLLKHFRVIIRAIMS